MTKKKLTTRIYSARRFLPQNSGPDEVVLTYENLVDEVLRNATKDGADLDWFGISIEQDQGIDYIETITGTDEHPYNSIRISVRGRYDAN